METRRLYDEEKRQEIQNQLPLGCVYQRIGRGGNDLHMIRCDGRPSVSLSESVGVKNRHIRSVITIEHPR